MGFPGGSAGKNLPAMQESQETLVWSLGQEDPLEEGMAIHSRILAWGILLTGEPGRLQSIGRKESDMSEATDHACILTNWITDWFNDHFPDPHDVPVPHEASGITDTRSEMASLAQLLLTLLTVHSIQPYKPPHHSSNCQPDFNLRAFALDLSPTWNIPPMVDSWFASLHPSNAILWWGLPWPSNIKQVPCTQHSILLIWIFFL